MSSNQEKNNQQKEDKNIQKKLKTLKLGLISQDSTYINVYQLFDSYFKYSKPENYKIKDENKYEFSVSSIPQLPISIYHIKKIEVIHDKYNKYNDGLHFFLIFIDIQENKDSNSFLDKALDSIIEADDNNLNKKFYIYGFYQNNDNEKITEEKITTLLEAKAIEYYYNETKTDDIESFSKLIECTITDCNNIMIEKYFIQKQNELIKDNSKSQCLIY